MVLSVIGGFFILLGGVALLFLGALVGALLSGLSIVPLGADPVAMLNTLGALGILFGLIDVALGVVMFIKPGLSKILGAVVLVVSLASIVSLGGFFLGLILGLVGGIMALIWKPNVAPAAYAPAMAPPTQ
jgi:hypothetical protein